MFRKFFSKLRQSYFARSVTVLAGGTAVAQAISLLALPLITRLYSPHDFSVFAVYVATIQVVSVAACMRFEIAIPLPKSDEDAASLLVLAFLSTILVASVVGLIAFGASKIYPDLSALVLLQDFLWLLPLGVFAAGFYSALLFWSTRKQRFSTIAKTRLSQSVAASSIQLGAGVAKLTPLGLIIGHILQSGAGMLALSRQVVLRDKDALRSVSFNRMRRVGLRYKQFPKYSVAEALAQAAGLNLPIIVIAASAVGPEAGFLILAMRATQAPMSLIGSAVGQVFASTAPDAHRNNDLCNVTAKTIGRILKLAAGPMLFFSVVAPEIFVFVFGPEWDRAGELVRWMTPLLLIHMMASSIGAVLYITDQQRLAFILQLTGAVIRIGSVFVIAKIASNWLSEAYAVSGALFYSAYLVVGLRCAGVSVDLLGHEVRKAVAHVVIWVVCAILCLHAINFLL